jgi:glycyl-tRNA synthetase beta chain
VSELLFEIGSEELPARVVAPAAKQLRESVLAALDEARLGHSGAAFFGTPRRLAVLVGGVAERQPDLTKDAVGPSVKAAYDADGRPTQAALGFARSCGVEVGQLGVVDTPKGKYLGTQIRQIGKPAFEVLPALLRQAIAGLSFPKSMRWGSHDETFARPLLWILALLDEKAVELEYAGVRSGHTSRGHRFLHPDPFPVHRPSDYLDALRKRGVEPDIQARRALIEKHIDKAAENLESEIHPASRAALLDEVTNLVEWPWPVVGSFDEKFTRLPREVLLSEMTVHQRYFAVGSDAKLLPRFVAIAGTQVRKPELAAHGFQRVLRARLSDAQFFWDEDRKKTLDSRVASLGSVLFQQKLGSVLEKAERVAGLADFLAGELGLAPEPRQAVARAAKLAKADLVTGMVGEFPELQGIMGGYYAEGDGEPAAVQLAIRDQYLPRFAGDLLPGSIEAVLLGIADRTDTLCGIFGIGRAPTGSADPFALRRSCLAVITLAQRWHGPLRFSLRKLLEQSVSLLAAKLSEPRETLLGKLTEFFRARLKATLAEEYSAEVAEAVLVAGFDDLWQVRKRAEALAAVMHREDFKKLAVAFKRTASILEKVPAEDLRGQVEPARFADAPEHQLWQSLLALQEDARLGNDDYQGALEAMGTLKPSIDLFFDKVLVMSDDPELRRNRVLLLDAVRKVFGRVADLSQLPGEKAGDRAGNKAGEKA